MFVCCECCVLSGRVLCDGLITRPEESYRLWCVVVCDLETTRMRRPWPALRRSDTEKNKNIADCSYFLSMCVGIPFTQYTGKRRPSVWRIEVAGVKRSRAAVFSKFVQDAMPWMCKIPVCFLFPTAHLTQKYPKILLSLLIVETSGSHSSQNFGQNCGTLLRR